MLKIMLLLHKIFISYISRLLINDVLAKSKQTLKVKALIGQIYFKATRFSSTKQQDVMAKDKHSNL